MTWPPRLAYLCGDPGIAPDGAKGASVHFRAMARALEGAGATVDVFMACPARGHGCASVKVVPVRRAPGLAGEVHVLSGSGAMLAALERHGPHDAVYERLSLFGTAGLAHARTLGVPFVVEVNAPLWEEAARYRSLRLRRTAHALATDVMTGADRVLVVSRELERLVVAEGVDPASVHVVGNGVDQALFDAATACPRPAALRDKPALVFVGSLKAWHGIEFLLEAYELCRRRRPLGLWIVGDGPLRGAVESAARRHPGDIVLEGAVEHERIPAILKASDAAVAPYPTDAPRYFCPLKVVEALAAGCPLVASRTPCVTDLVDGPEPPGLFRAGDAEDFARAVERVLDRGRRDVLARRDLSWARRARQVLAWIGAPRPGLEVQTR